MVSTAEAEALVMALVPPLSPESVPLQTCVGRRLWSPVIADRDGPPFDRVVLDGYAVSALEGAGPWRVEGLQVAGGPPAPKGAPEAAIEVTTGAVVPDGRDAVVPYEDTLRDGQTVALRVGADVPVSGQAVHRRGSDFRQGQRLLAGGTVLRSPHLHLLASCGVDPVPVVRRATWALVTTGDEVVAVDRVPQPWQIRRSNGAAIAGEARSWGLSPLAEVHGADDRAALTRCFETILPGLDVLVVTGGVSAGVRDLVPRVLKALGAEEVLHGVAQRPGKPLWVGRIPRAGGHTVIFGLPGNPVSSLVSFRRYVVPWLLAFEGAPAPSSPQAVDSLPSVPSGFTWFLPWSPTAGLLDRKSSGDYFALSDSTGFVEWSGTGVPQYFPWGGPG